MNTPPAPKTHNRGRGGAKGESLQLVKPYTHVQKMLMACYCGCHVTSTRPAQLHTTALEQRQCITSFRLIQSQEVLSRRARSLRKRVQYSTAPQQSIGYISMVAPFGRRCLRVCFFDGLRIALRKGVASSLSGSVLSSQLAPT